MKFDWQRLWPKYWLQHGPTNYEWDAILNQLLDKHEPKVSHLTVYLGKVEVWIGNWPYAYGAPYHNGLREMVPTVATRKRLKSIIGDDDNLAEIRELLE